MYLKNSVSSYYKIYIKLLSVIIKLIFFKFSKDKNRKNDYLYFIKNLLKLKNNILIKNKDIFHLTKNKNIFKFFIHNYF